MPPILKIDVGDSVLFKSIDKGHNSASKRGMIPISAETWNSAMDEDIEVTFDVDGTYGYICLPYYQMSMVGLILVGDYRSNLEKAKRIQHRGQAGVNVWTM